MVNIKVREICDDTDLVTNLVTKQNANSKVGVYLRGKPRIYWLRE
jgi:hypothetical protein